MHDKKATHWLAVDVVQKHVNAAADQVGRYEAAGFAEWMSSMLGPDDDMEAHWRLGLESPLEAICYIWWQAMVGRRGWIGSRVHLDPQQEIEVFGVRYRIDFALVPEASFQVRCEASGVRFPSIAVEVDGHGFHEKTPAQVAERNERDRLLQQAGWLVLHYSWTEMTTRPEECIGEIAGVAKQAIWDVERQINAAERAAGNQAGAQTSQES